ncbi:MAG: TIGR01777 family oxidoreductase [Chlamydiota bacterium]|jgi:uncharacterized protein (TIGR01777 family)
MRVLVTGSTGFIGKNFCKYLQENGIDVLHLSRKPSKNSNTIFWNPEKEVLDQQNIDRIDAVVHLAGENVAGLWTRRKKEKIYRSRVHGTKFLAESLKRVSHPPKAFICASAVGLYGSRKEEVLEESSSPGAGFLSNVTYEWEKAAEVLNNLSRVVHFRFGLVLGRDGGLLPKMTLAYKFGLGGKIGSGEQFLSWVSVDDVCKMLFLALTKEDMQGPFNAVSPQPIQQKEFGKTLAEVLGKPFCFHMPSFLLKLFLGNQAKEMFLASTRVVPKRLFEMGYQFLDQDLRKTFLKYVKKT